MKDDRTHIKVVKKKLLETLMKKNVLQEVEFYLEELRLI